MANPNDTLYSILHGGNQGYNPFYKKKDDDELVDFTDGSEFIDNIRDEINHYVNEINIGGGVRIHGLLLELLDDDHPQYVLHSIADAKGDLLAATGNNVFTRHPVGTDGYALFADSSQATGLRWGPIGDCWYDYVVASDGSGTHTTLATAVAAAIAAGGYKSIKMCNDETLSGAIDIGGIAGTILIAGPTTTPGAGGAAAANVAKVIITAASGNPILTQTTNKSGSARGIVFLNIGLVTEAAEAVFEVAFTGGNVTEADFIDFYDCFLDVGYAAAGDGVANALGGLTTRMHRCAGDVTAFTSATGGAAGVDEFLAWDCTFSLGQWWNTSSSGTWPDLIRVEDGFYNQSVAQALNNSTPAGITQARWSGMTLRSSIAGDTFTMSNTAASGKNITFQNIEFIAADDDTKFGNFESASVNPCEGLYFDDIFGYPEAGVTPSGDFITVDGDWLDVFAGSVFAPAWDNTFGGAGADALQPYVRHDGTVPLTADWPAGFSFSISAGKFIIDDANFYLDGTAAGSTNFGGNTSIGGTTDVVSAHEQNATKVVLTQDLIATSISSYVDLNTGTRNFWIAVYSNNAGTPDDLLFYCDQLTATTTAAWHTSVQLRDPAGAAISSYTLAAGTYWISTHVRGGGGFDFSLFYDAGSAGDSYENNADDFDTGPEDPWAGGSSGSRLYSMYITGTIVIPRIVFDSTDYIQYTRSSNLLSFNIASTSELEIDASGARESGYLRVGSISAPLNTDAGDATIGYLNVGNAEAQAETGGSFPGLLAQITGTSVATAAGAHVGIGAYYLLDPSGDSASEFRAINFQNVIASTVDDNFSGRLSGGYFEGARWQGSGNLSSTSTRAGQVGVTGVGVAMGGGADDAGTAASTAGIVGLGFSRATASFSTRAITVARGLFAPNTDALDGLTIGTYIGVDVAALTSLSVGAGRIGFRNADTTVFTPSANQVIDAATDVISPNATFIDISNTTGGSITLTSAPTIADGAVGQVICIMNVGTQDVVLQDQGTLASSNLRLSATGITLGPRDSICLRYSDDIGDWVQFAQTNVI